MWSLRHKYRLCQIICSISIFHCLISDGHIFHPPSMSKAVKLNVQEEEEKKYTTKCSSRANARRGIYHSFVHTLAVAKRERVNFLYDTKKKRESSRESGARKSDGFERSFCHALALQEQEIAFEEIRMARQPSSARAKFLGTMLCFSSSTFELDRIFFDRTFTE